MTSAAHTAPAAQEQPRDEVVLRVPADPAYLTVVRTATAGLAARLDLTLDEIEDLRIAVDEASALLLAGANEDDDLSAAFSLDADVLDVRVAGPARRLPEPHSFSWSVLQALVGEVRTGSGPTGSWIGLRHRRAVRDR